MRPTNHIPIHNEELQATQSLSDAMPENADHIMEEVDSDIPTSTVKFIHTKGYKRFCEFCKACNQERYIGLCYGQAGIGKSMSARQFASWDLITEDFKKSVPYMADQKPSLDMTTCNTIVYTPEVTHSPKSISNDITKLTHAFNRLKEKYLYPEEVPWETRRLNYVELLIIDEADRLQPKALEQVRDIYDKNNIAVIMIGMPGIEKSLTRFPQLYSRVGFVHHFKQLSMEEISFIITHHCNELGIGIDIKDFTDHEAIAAMARITQGCSTPQTPKTAIGAIFDINPKWPLLETQAGWEFRGTENPFPKKGLSRNEKHVLPYCLQQ